MKKIIIDTIPVEKMRYITEGDYYLKNGIRYIKVADYHDEDVEFIVAVHELLEEYLTRKRGITEEDITKFDIESGLEDPGLSKKAPYYKEHAFSVKIEKLLCKELGITYKKYNNTRPWKF